MNVPILSVTFILGICFTAESQPATPTNHGRKRTRSGALITAESDPLAPIPETSGTTQSETQTETTTDPPQKHFVIFGAPAAGKGTQCKLLTKNFPNILSHISTGDVLREKYPTHPAVLGGGLVDDDTLRGVVEECLNRNANIPCILWDGFPRNLAQIDMLDKCLKERNCSVNKVIELYTADAQFELILARINERFLQEGRKDDNPKAFQQRWSKFRESSVPVVCKYRENYGEEMVQTFQADGDKNDIHAGIVDALDLRRICDERRI